MDKFKLFGFLLGGVLFGMLIFAFLPEESRGGIPFKRIFTATSTSVSVAPTSVQLAAADGNRNGIIFSRPPSSTSTIWLACGFSAVSGAGIVLTTSSPRYEDRDSGLVCDWNGISDNASATIGVFRY